MAAGRGASMLEIIAIYLFCKNVGNIIRNKGRKPIGYQLMTVAFWFGGEILGAIAGMIFFGFEEESINPLVYVAALVGALIGGIVAMVIAKQLPNQNRTGFDTVLRR
jgi:hypothetical protein